MKNIKHAKAAIGLFLILALAFAFCACGSDSSDSSSGEYDEDTVSEEVAQMAEEARANDISQKEKDRLKREAKVKNQVDSSFYGTWVATSANAENLYGNFEITINEDNTFDANVTGEKFSGTWEKQEKGISFESELLTGELYFGDRCRMVVHDEYDTRVTLVKKD